MQAGDKIIQQAWALSHAKRLGYSVHLTPELQKSCCTHVVPVEKHARQYMSDPPALVLFLDNAFFRALSIHPICSAGASLPADCLICF